MNNIITMDSFAILLDSFSCNRSCPYCISKNDHKFNFESEESFVELKNIFKDLRKENIRFNKIIIIGNGEPTVYPFEVLKEIVDIIITYKDLFGYIDYYTSGLIFNQNEKFELFNNTIKYGIETRFIICIISFDFDLDRKILGHKVNYFNENFKSANNIKLSICLTKYLNLNSLYSDIEMFVKKYNNIDTINFKVLRAGKNIDNKEGQWVLNHALTKEDIERMKFDIINFFTNEAILKNIKLEYGKERQPRRYLIYTKEKLYDFNENEIKVNCLRNLFYEGRIGIYE